jgi:hypothetical protein
MTRTVLACVIAAAAAAASAGASPSHEALIRPGVGIGAARLGMTTTQLRAAMGKPLAVLSQPASYGRTSIEWQYGYGAFTVRLEGPRRALRVVSVATTLRRERTREGLGVGTLEARVERAYAGRIRCERLRTGGASDGRSTLVVVLDQNRDCVVSHPNGTRTVFRTWVKPGVYEPPPTPERWEKDAQVLEVSVRS